MDNDLDMSGFQIDASPFPTLTASPSFVKYSTPKRTAKIGDAYVLQIAATNTHYAIAASAPSNAIHLFDKGTLQTTGKLPGHPEGISAITTQVNGESSSLLSCGKDASIKIWDERSQKNTLELRTSGRPRPLLSLDISLDGHTIATGSELGGDDACILFFDIRSPAAPLRSHSQTHSQDITVVKFAPNARILLSASSDGLLCTSDPDQQDEDEAGIHVGNWGCSIAQAGWIDDNAAHAPAAWAASDMETFSLWTRELDVIQSFDVRKPSMSGTSAWSTDYFIGAQVSSSRLYTTDNGLRLFFGSNDTYSARNLTVPSFLRGTFAIVSPDSTGSQSDIKALKTHAQYDGPHAGVVRAVHWDEAAGVLLSGGEDGTLCAWKCPPLVAEDAMEEEELGGLGGRGVVVEESEGDDEMEIDAAPGVKRKRDGGPEVTGKKSRTK